MIILISNEIAGSKSRKIMNYLKDLGSDILNITKLFIEINA
jgi:hypothetical protein